MSRRLKLLLPVPALLAVLLALFGFTSRAADNPVLTSDVGQDDQFTLTFVDSSGAKVTHLDPGTYTINVHDHSTFHNFHLFGPGGVNVSTTIPQIADATFTVTLTSGTYTVQCDAHASAGMKLTFTVGTPPAPAPAPAPAPKAAKLSAHVGPGVSIGVRGAANVLAGKAVITVSDRSKKDNFHLSGPGVSKKTGVAFRGTVTWKVTLQTGAYTFRSDTHKKLHGSFVVNSAGGSYGAPG
jgi:hypothetical protein